MTKEELDRLFAELDRRGFVELPGLTVITDNPAFEASLAEHQRHLEAQAATDAMRRQLLEALRPSQCCVKGCDKDNYCWFKAWSEYEYRILPVCLDHAGFEGDGGIHELKPENCGLKKRDPATEIKCCWECGGELFNGVCGVHIIGQSVKYFCGLCHTERYLAARKVVLGGID